jgi:hypothetical protein
MIYSNFTHDFPGATGMELITRISSLEVSLSMYISRWQIYGFNLWTSEHVQLFGYNVCGRCGPMETLITIQLIIIR